MKSIEQRWKDFRARVMDPDCPEIQVREMRLAFFAGFRSMLDATVFLAGFDERLAVVELEKLHIEARAFGDPSHNQQGDDE